MFGAKDKTTKTTKAPAKRTPASNQTTLLTQGTRVTGDVSFEGNLQLEGIVEGSVSATIDQSTIQLVNSGRIKGELRVPRAIIDGRIEGDVYASEYVELAANARVEGDVYYAELEMIKGARINGQLIYSSKEGELGEAKDSVSEKKNNEKNPANIKLSANKSVNVEAP